MLDWHAAESEFDIWQIVIHTQTDKFVNMKQALAAKKTQQFYIRAASRQISKLAFFQMF